MFSRDGLKALTNGNMKIHKVLALPPSLEEDSIYFVKNGTGADLYIVSNEGDAVKVSSGVDYGLTLGESTTTAYQGDRGKYAYDHAQSPHVETKTDIGLGHVNNTSDLDKPISTATQAALDALTKDDVGLDNVDNTSDINKPVSTAQQAAIDAAGGGSSFDQDLNTTDSPTFATLTTTDTIATDVYAVDVSATGTVTAGGFVGTPQTLTDAATITYDLADGHNAKVTLTASRTLSLPSNLAEGASGVLTITQDGTGGHGLTLATGWFVSAGALSDISALGASEQAQITWYAYASNKVNATILPLQ